MLNVRLKKGSVETLRTLGLVDYEIKAIASLATRRVCTIKDIQENTNIPRTKIYDTMKSLDRKGWVQNLRGRPRRYQLRPVAELLEEKRRVLELSIEELEAELEILEEMKEGEVPQVVLVSGQTSLLNKIKAVASKAQKELFIVAGTILENEIPLLENVIGHLQARDVRIRAILRPEMKQLSKLLDKYKVPYKILPAPFFHVVVADWERTVVMFGQVKDAKVVPSTMNGIYIPYREFNAMIEMQFKLLWKEDFFAGFFDEK